MARYRGKHEAGSAGYDREEASASAGRPEDMKPDTPAEEPAQPDADEETAQNAPGGEAAGGAPEDSGTGEAAPEEPAPGEPAEEGEIASAAGNGKMKKPRLTKKARTILIVILAAVFLVCAALIIYRVAALKSEESDLNDLAAQVSAAETETPAATETAATPTPKYDENGILTKYSGLYKNNSDLAGWIKIDGTVIDYPVMYTPTDMEYYIHTGFSKQYAYAGLPFIDANCNPFTPTANQIIYAHNMNDGSMFAGLLKYEDESYYSAHKYIEFDTIYKEQKYEIIAACYTHVLLQDEEGFRYYRFYDAANEEEFNDYIDNIKAIACYDTGVTAKYGDELITLSTCSYQVEEGRFIVVAKKIS